MARNISSSLVLNIDKDKAMNEGIIDIDKNRGEQIAQQILNETYKKPAIFTEPTMEIIYESNDYNKVYVTVLTTFSLKEKLAFYKHATINSKSKYKAYTKMQLQKMSKEELEEVRWNDILKSMVFEEVF